VHSNGGFIRKWAFKGRRTTGKKEQETSATVADCKDVSKAKGGKKGKKVCGYLERGRDTRGPQEIWVAKLHSPLRKVPRKDEKGEHVANRLEPTLRGHKKIRVRNKTHKQKQRRRSWWRGIKERGYNQRRYSTTQEKQERNSRYLTKKGLKTPQHSC